MNKNLKSEEGVTLFWFRRDLRINDNKGLYEALKASSRVLPLFIFDEDILDRLPPDDHRVEFIYEGLGSLQRQLNECGSGLVVRKGKPFEVFIRLLREYRIEAVYSNGDHEPYGLSRDEKMKALLESHGIPFFSFNDHLVFGKNEVLKADGSPYLVFTPYSRQWKQALKMSGASHYPSESLGQNYVRGDFATFPSPEDFGFKRSGMEMPGLRINEGLIRRYDKTRNFPFMDGTSRLGPHLRFGTISLRKLVNMALNLNEVFLNELIWREFYAMILWHFPKVVNHSFKAVYDRLSWSNDEEAFRKWKAGLTGYPMVDAGMRQLNATGFMHNRLRMITASFLVKHLLIDWRWGESWFGERLFDYELSSNNGGWQWSAGTGCDAAPYFRVFNPTEQQKKFDPESEFVKKWIPELGSPDYPGPLVDHKMARERWLREVKELVILSRKNH